MHSHKRKKVGRKWYTGQVKTTLYLFIIEHTSLPRKKTKSEVSHVHKSHSMALHPEFLCY